MIGCGQNSGAGQTSAHYRSVWSLMGRIWWYDNGERVHTDSSLGSTNL